MIYTPELIKSIAPSIFATSASNKLSNKYGKLDLARYSFLQTRSFSSSTPTRHDKLVVHLPINYTFGEYLGFYVKIFAYDVLNQTSFDLSNFYFDMTDSSQGYIMNFSSPPLLFSEKLWGKNITIDFPSVAQLSSQRVNNRPKESSLNANLTNGSGFSLNTPVFIDFHFINNKISNTLFMKQIILMPLNTSEKGV